MSDQGEQDTKPDTGAGELLNIKVLGHDSSVIQFKIKKQTSFAKLMKIYCERMNLSPQAVRFLFDGDRVLKSDTPASINMVEGDTLEVLTLQEGGAKWNPTSETAQRLQTFGMMLCG